MPVLLSAKRPAKPKPVPKNRPLPTVARNLRIVTLSGVLETAAVHGRNVWHHTCLVSSARYACAACGHCDCVANMHAVPLSDGALVVCKDRGACATRRS